MFDKITTSAIGGPETLNPDDPNNQYNGIYSWARLGFDSLVPDYVHAHCSGELLSYTRVTELMASKQGRKIWARHARSLELEFDLAQDSASWKILRAYLLEKEIRVVP